ncbi:pilus assembly protein [Methylobacterium sp. BTF04]|uniref:TadE/TadG family type IV pilus assembly protein n=1 Tax=Methylobacterium sp. BTF04 TaxID=2708300 RepID=UPI0013D0735F|nr:pilus assembly protein [Methylobacterium sp. BTF04]
MFQGAVVKISDWKARFIYDKSGAAAVEFALTAIPFLGFIFVIIQVGLYFFSQQSLDYATRLAARQIMTGYVQAKSLTADQLRSSIICPALSINISCNNITVAVNIVPKTSNSTSGTGIYAYINQSVPSLKPANLDASKGTFCTGSPGDYIFIDVAYNFSGFLDLIPIIAGPLISRDIMVLRSTAFIANEPFQSAAGSTQSGC